VVLSGRLVGTARIEDVLAASPDDTLGRIMDPGPPSIAPGADQERAAWHAVQSRQASIVVDDESGRFQGLIPSWRMLSVLLNEHDEDMARLGGFLHDTEAARTASEENVARRFWHRPPWLLVGLAGALVAAVIVQGFEEQLEANVLVALFIPGIVCMADAVGTQTETVLIRGLSVVSPSPGSSGGSWSPDCSWASSWRRSSSRSVSSRGVMPRSSSPSASRCLPRARRRRWWRWRCRRSSSAWEPIRPSGAARLPP
jgi:hypothetical protein